ncbi:MAG TPA: RagB/SusD family nutrient uptake outer membrane protein, partial [Sphingobacteriaceae bacterium]
MKKIIYAFACLTGLLTLASCSKETIDGTPVQYTDAKIIYGQSVNIGEAVNRLYVYAPAGHNRLGGNSMVASATDEAVHAVRGSEAERWGTGLWGTTATTLRDDDFARTYEGIRATHVYEEEIHNNIIDAVMSQTDRNYLLGQALFIRALLNFELLKRYGGYPIVKRALKIGDDMNIPKSSYDECVKYISDLCDESQALLRVSYPAAGDFGRATKGSAMALKARLLLYAASPLNNPNNDISKWQAAAAAADAVIKSNQYSLYTAGSGYDAFFNTLANNKEI